MLTLEKKTVKAGKFVDTTHVDNVIKNYKRERWVHNSKRLGKEDSLSVWYSVAELEEFLEKARLHGGDGVKIYFGAYDAVDAPKPGYEGRQTVVLVATKQKETETGFTNKDIYIQQGEESTILAYNLGKICPPSCNSGDTGIGITIIDKGEGEVVIA